MTSNEEYIRKNKVQLVDDDKNTKLHYACALGNLEEVQKEVATGRKIDPENYLGWTPLMMAIRNGHLEIVTFLLENHANSTKKNKFGMDAFLISVASGSLEIVTKLLNHLLYGGVSRRILQRVLSPISLSIMFGHSQIFKYLIDMSFDVNSATPLTGISPAMFAAAMRNNKAMKYLREQKADMNQKNYSGRSASEILESQSKRFQTDDSHLNKNSKLPLPVIILSSPSPNLQLTPDLGLSNYPNTRKSSNTRTPNVIWTPGISPITPQPQFMPQFFFPPTFNPAQYVSPNVMECQGYNYNSNEFLNAHIYAWPSPGIYQTPQPHHLSL